MIFAENIKICLMIGKEDSTPSSENPSILKWYEIFMLGKKKKPNWKKNQSYFGIF